MTALGPAAPVRKAGGGAGGRSADIVYEDSALLVINKPAGMVVHPAPGSRSGTLVNALLYHSGSLSASGDAARPGIVHRIDKDTTGLLVVAKNETAHRSLAVQLKAHSIKRKYIALVRGDIEEDGGTIEAPIGRHPVDRKRMAVVARNCGMRLPISVL